MRSEPALNNDKSETVTGRAICLEHFKQGLCEVYEKREGAEDC